MILRFGKLFIFILVAILYFNYGCAQQRKMSEMEKKKEKVERSYKKAYNKARKKTIKHRREIQTDETKKRMDEIDRRAKANNKNKEGFIKRNFKRKRPPGR